MPNWILYAVVMLSWGSSWLAIQYQLGDVHPQMSVAYRFILSGSLLILYCWVRHKKMKFTVEQHMRIGLQALFIFSTNYIFIYHSSQHLSSGLVSIVFSVLTFFNIFNARLFLQQKISGEVVFASLLGFIGIILVFSEELKNVNASKEIIIGAGLALVASYSASLGNIISANNQKRNLPILQSTAIGMLYGGVWTLVLSLFMGVSLTFSTTSAYLGSLLFLSLVASILAFLSYLTLLSKIGPSRAGYCTLAFPIIAVTLSIFFENYKLDITDIVGFVLVLSGNYIVMFKPQLGKVPTKSF